MSDLTGGARPVALTSAFSRPAAQAPAAPANGLTAAELRAELARMPLQNLRRGYRTEAVERLVERVARELERRQQGMAPLLRASDVHADGFAMARPGYGVEQTRALLAKAAEALGPDSRPRPRGGVGL